MNNCAHKPAKSFFAGMMIGAAAGAIAGILFAPKSGEETRADITKYAAEMKDKITDEIGRAGEFTRDNYQTVVEKVVDIYQRAKKITAEEAANLKKNLNKNYEEIQKNAQKKSR